MHIVEVSGFFGRRGDLAQTYRQLLPSRFDQTEVETEATRCARVSMYWDAMLRADMTLQNVWFKRRTEAMREALQWTESNNLVQDMTHGLAVFEALFSHPLSNI